MCSMCSRHERHRVFLYAPEPRSVQENVNTAACLLSVSPVRDSNSARGASHTRAALRGRPRAASSRNGADKPTRRVQTNLSCPCWPARDISVPSSCRKQSNLECKLQRRGARIGDPHFRPAGLVSRSGQLGLKRAPPKNVSSGHHSSPRTCWTFSNTRLRNGALKRPPGRLSRHLESHGDASFLSKLCQIPGSVCFRHNCPPSLRGPDRSAGASWPSPALTLELLETSSPAESSETFQALVRSSRTSAKLHGSLQRLEQQLSMGGLGSSQWESKSPRPYKPSPGPWGWTAGTPSLSERLAAEQNYAKHARVSWPPSFRQEWGSGSTGDDDRAPLPTGFKDLGLYGAAMEPPDAPCLAGFSSHLGPTLLGPGEDVISSPSFRFEAGSGIRPAPEWKRKWCDSKTSCNETVLGPAGPPPVISCLSVVDLENLPSGPLSLGDLEVPLQRLGSKPSVDVGLATYGPPKEAPLRVGSLAGLDMLPACWFQIRPQDLAIREPPGELGGEPFLANLIGDSRSLLARRRLSPFGEAARKGLGGRARAADGTNVVGFVHPVGGTAADSSNFTGCSSWTGEGRVPKQAWDVLKTQQKAELSGRKEKDHSLGPIQEEVCSVSRRDEALRREP